MNIYAERIEKIAQTLKDQNGNSSSEASAAFTQLMKESSEQFGSNASVEMKALLRVIHALAINIYVEDLADYEKYVKILGL